MLGSISNDCSYVDVPNVHRFGGLGSDILEGQEGDDILVGGSGLDSRTINMKAYHRAWDDGVSDTLKGGYGDDRYLIYHENGSSGNWYSSPETMLDVIDKIDERDGDGRGTISIQKTAPDGRSGGSPYLENTSAYGQYIFAYNNSQGAYYFNIPAYSQYLADMMK